MKETKIVTRRNRLFLMSLIAFFNFGLHFPVQAQLREPTDIELKASYCIAVLNHSARKLAAIGEPLSNDIKASAEKMKRDNDRNLRRLQAYLVPKVQYIDVLGLEAARHRGEQDSKDLDADVEGWQKLRECFGQCEMQKRDSQEACLDNCSKLFPLLSRIQSCHKLEWLPF